MPSPSKIGIDRLYIPEAPWIYADVVSDAELKWLPSVFYAAEGVSSLVRVLRGKKMRTVSRLMDEFGAALQFFQGFGENWHALKDDLSSLSEWLPAASYLLVISDPHEVLAEEPGELKWLVATLNETGAWWSRPIEDNGVFNRPAIPFHTVLRMQKRDKLAFLDRYGDVPCLREPAVSG